MTITYDRRLGRYRDERGRLISEARVRLAVDTVADAASDRMADLTERMARGDLTLRRWQAEMMRTIKVSHVAAGVAASGGRAQMTPASYGFLGAEIRTQYGYLRNFADGIASEAVPLDRRAVARAGMYGQHARVTYEAVRARDAAGQGVTEERNVLHALESCRECIGLSRQGWVALGSLPPIGSRQCLSRCRCTITRRRLARSSPAPIRAVA
jgi:hypothetical protein